MLTFYAYKNCDSCRNAEKFLKSHAIPYRFVDITLDPPPAELLLKLKNKSSIDVKKFLNTSGEAYRSLGLKDKLSSMSDTEIFQLLATNGRLIKRPLITDGVAVTLGFKPGSLEVWTEA